MSLTGVRLRRFLPVLVLATLSLTRMAISSEPLVSLAVTRLRTRRLTAGSKFTFPGATSLLPVHDS